MTKCKTCDRPEATPTEWDTVNGGERPDLCFGEHLGCSAHRVDWRERALAAEGERDGVRTLASTILESVRQERDKARQIVCALLSPVDAVRAEAVKNAAEARRGWGM